MAEVEFEPIVLDFQFFKNSIISDFLRDTGLDKSFRLTSIVTDDYDDFLLHIGFKNDPQRVEKKGGPDYHTKRITRLALIPLDEETHFYWKLKGHKKLHEAIEDYIAARPFNKGVS